MADTSDTAEQEREVEDEAESEEQIEREEEAVLDLDAEGELQDVESLQEELDEQRERIEELEDLVLDLSVRVADDRAMGVCPDCHGPLVKKKRWLGRSSIDCTRCGRTFHKY
jgi:hypothetical protein